MKKLVLSAAIALVGLAQPHVAVAGDLDPGSVELPWMNGPSRDARYRLSDHPNTVHVFEVYRLSCSWCNRNAPQVKAMAAEYASDERVQFVDLGQDTNDRDYARWIQQHTPTYPVVKDVNLAVWNQLASRTGVPQTFVVACDGTLVDQTLGYWGAEEKATLRAAVARAKSVTCE